MIRAAAAVLLGAVLAGGCGTARAGGSAGGSASAREGAALEAVIDAIQQALSEAQAEEVAAFPPLKAVTVKLQTEASRSVGGEIAVYVFSLGSKYTAESASTLELKLKPPDAKSPRGLKPEDLTQALARAIHAAKVGALRAASGKPPFVLAAVDVDVKFAVETTGEAGARVALVPLGAEAGGKLNRNQVHTVSLTFAP